MAQNLDSHHNSDSWPRDNISGCKLKQSYYLTYRNMVGAISRLKLPLTKL